MIDQLYISLHAALIGICWVYILTEDSGIFSWWPAVVHKVSGHPMVFKIAYQCEKCIAGQVAFWWAFFYFSYDLWMAVCCSLYAMLIAYVTGLLLQKIDRL